jgi:hypothetical protein
MTCSSNGCNRMGFHASPKNDLGDLYLTTQSADAPPYCQFPYQITLTSANFRTRKQTSGKVYKTLNNNEYILEINNLKIISVFNFIERFLEKF